MRADNAEGYYGRGRIHLALRRFEDAIADLTRANELGQEDMEVLAARGIAHAWESHRAAAMADRDRVSVLDPRHAALPRIDAILALRSDDPPALIQQLTTRLQADPYDELALWHRGHIYWEMGEHDLARDDDDRLSRLREWRGAEVHAQEVR